MTRRGAIGISVVAVVLAIVAAVGWWLPRAAVPGGQAQVVERIGIDTSDNSSIYSGGKLTLYTDDHSTTSMLLDSAAGAIKVAGPTTVATATPVAVIDSLGVSNIFEVRDAATPVFVVRNGGTLVGALGYATAGQKIICGSTNITGTGVIAHALATPSFVQLSLAQDVTGDCARLSYTNSAATVTAKCWNSALTPAAAAAVAAVNWCVIGTP